MPESALWNARRLLTEHRRSDNPDILETEMAWELYEALEALVREIDAREFRVRVEKDDLDGGWTAEAVELPGCMSQGDTKEEALLNLADAIGGVLLRLDQTASEVARLAAIEANRTTRR